MRLTLLKILKEEIKEQGYGFYMQDTVLPTGERVGDVSGFDFESNKILKKSKKELQPKVKNKNNSSIGSTYTYDSDFKITGDLSSSSEFPEKGQQLKNDKYFILHHTAYVGDAASVVNTLNTRDVGVLGIQWIIDRKGLIFRGLPPGSIGAHVKSDKKYKTAKAPKDLGNSTSQGVEIVAKNDNDVLDIQCFSALKLIKYLNYPLENIYGHGEVNNHKAANEGKKCKSFITKNWDKSLEDVASELEEKENN